MLYRIMLFVHVMGVIMWLGAGIVFQLLTERAVARNDESKMRMLISLGDTFGAAYFGILTAVVLVSGLVLVFDGDWDFEQIFVAGGIAGILSSGAIGGAVIAPTSKKLQERMAAGGTIDAEAVADITRIRNVGRIDLAILIIVVFLMTYKPGL